VDVNWWGIRTLQLLGLAKNIKLIDATGKAKEVDSLKAQLKRAA
jgi:hypothetical protein